MKRNYVVGLVIILVIVILATFYFLNSRNATSFEKTVSELGFNTSTEYQGISAKMVCQDADCITLFPTERLNKCSSLWNSSYEKSSAVGKPVYYSTAVLDYENKKYIYYYESPPTKIKVAELKN